MHEVRGEAYGPVAATPETFREGGKSIGQDIPGPSNAVIRRKAASEERSHGRERPRTRSGGVAKDRALRSQRIEHRRRSPIVSVEAQMVGAKGVHNDEHDVRQLPVTPGAITARDAHDEA